MTPRERLLSVYRWEAVDRVPDVEWGPWDQTLTRWQREGLPKDMNIWEYFHTDSGGFSISFNNYLLPGFEEKVLEEKGDHLIMQDGDGVICEMLRPELGASIPRYLRHPIESRADWERMRDERLDPDDPQRVPENLEELCRQSFDSESAVSFTCASVYGWLRNWMGVERISVAIMEDTPWVKEMMTHLMDIVVKGVEKIAGRCRVDVGGWWEDMCFNKGPLVSPRWFAEHMVPQYRRVTDLLRRECGCEFNLVDCDGRIEQIAPLWLEGGVNVFTPVEVAHNDAYQLRRLFPRRFAIEGQFDKRALIAGREAIDREFERLRPMLAEGGLIPNTDHAVPPDVSWENFCYYRERKLEFIGKEPVPLGRE